MPSDQQSATTWQGREVTHEEAGPVLEVLSSAHIMAQVLSFLPPADMSRSAVVCHFFRVAKALVDVEQARALALAFGLPQEFSFRVEGSPCRPLDESDPIVVRLIQIERTLPEDVRKQNSREALRVWREKSSCSSPKKSHDSSLSDSSLCAIPKSPVCRIRFFILEGAACPCTSTFSPSLVQRYMAVVPSLRRGEEAV